MTWLLIVCFPALLLMSVFVLLTLKKESKKTFQHNSPTVAILVAARNEEHNIIKCLAALEQLSYNKEQLTILIGDDHSDDKTGELIKEFVKDKPQFHYHLITEKKYGLKAKANVLEQLVEYTDAAYLFITDADIQVPTHWVQNMLKQFDEDTGVVTGVTAIKGDSLLARMQNIDWLFALGLAHVLSLFKIPVTCMGNNMAVKRRAYDDVGGYKRIGFSVTEDFHLFRALLDKGWGFKNLYSKGVLAYSQPMKSFKQLLSQRKRWVNGGMNYSILKLLPLLVFPLFYIGVLVGILLDWKLFLSLLCIMLCLKVIIITNCFPKIGKSKLITHLVGYEIYCVIIMVGMVFYYPFSGKVNWKDRKI